MVKFERGLSTVMAQDLAINAVFSADGLFLLAALMYFLMSWPLSMITRRIELRMQHSKKSLPAWLAGLSA